MATIALISCTKSKRRIPCEAAKLYNEKSPWFRYALQYADLVADKAFILSAKHGLLELDHVIEPYNETLNDKDSKEREEWGRRVVAQLKSKTDVNKDHYVIIAGKTYYQEIIPFVNSHDIPLKGKTLAQWSGKLQELISDAKSQDQAKELHRIFNSTPRYRWDMIGQIPFKDGIYIFFEQEETFLNMDRIVRVGTHRSPGRLKERLRDHFINENADGSIFRKNLGRALLHGAGHEYAAAWEIDIRKPENKRRYGDMIDEELESRIEKRISEILQEKFTFTCFPVLERQERLRLEEGMIASLHQDPSFGPSDQWVGAKHPFPDISESGLWNREGLAGNPLTHQEMARIASLANLASGKYKSVINESNDTEEGRRKASVESPMILEKANQFSDLQSNSRWGDLQGKILKTSTGKEFRVDRVQIGQYIQVTPMSTGKIRKIQWVEVERAYEELQNAGEINVHRIRECGASKANPSYVFNMLVHLINGSSVRGGRLFIK